MSRVYTARLGMLLGQGTGDFQAAVVPPGRRYVVRDIALYSLTVGVDISVYAQTPAGAVTIALFRTVDLHYQRLELRQVLNEGDQLRVSSASNVWTILITGYDFLVSSQ